MRGTSGASLEQARELFEPILRDAGAEALELGRQLYTVVGALDGSATLRRSLTDPSRSGEDKAALVAGVLGGFDGRVVDLVSGLARSRWSEAVDLADALERLAVDAVLASAESRGALETVEDELFTLGRGLDGSREARQALSDDSVAPERRVALVAEVLHGTADEVTAFLAEQGTRALRGRRYPQVLRWLGEVAAERRGRLVASVTAAVPLTTEQQERISAALESAYGRAVQINVSIDPEVLGGLRVQVGADVIDSTIVARLADARRRLAG
ncbi:F0F1 ATP synthase subunit delta [Paraoerskovia marina]|uniref:F0F1 ATP synthase subunit delta n=1 Tax=Paraoerskovia marina TaxID=545619 RepID=UPI0004929FB5|nr:F0F1 ATP synthase subunit delta [Paraoerskovia marina]